MAATAAVLRGREREKKDTGSGRTWAENSDKLSDKGRARAGPYIRSLVSIKSSPSTLPPICPGPYAPAYPDATPLVLMTNTLFRLTVLKRYQSTHLFYSFVYWYLVLNKIYCY